MEPIHEKKRGLILGKFLPPHLGHQYLADFARHYCDDLTILVSSLKAEPIPGNLRFQWMREMCPTARVIHVTDENPQFPEEHPDFWAIWKETIHRAAPDGAELLFASEEYGWKLAEVLGMEYVPVDHKRSMVPVSGSAIREAPLKHWKYLPSVVRPYFVKRVCITGPESTGKSMLTKALATHYDTVFVHEYARDLLDHSEEKIPTLKQIDCIARGHKASEEALASQANRILFSDTDTLVTKIWSEVLCGSCPDWILKRAAHVQYDLTLLLDIDVPWVDDDQRYLPKQRQWFLNRCLEELALAKRPYVLISGSWEERFKKAVAAVDRLLSSGTL